MRRDAWFSPFRGFLPVPWVVTHGYNEASRCDENPLFKRFEILDAGAGVEDDDGLVFVDEVLVDQFS